MNSPYGIIILILGVSNIQLALYGKLYYNFLILYVVEFKRVKVIKF